MKLTNRKALPQPIVDAVANDPYSRGEAHISITELIAPVRQVALKRLHEEAIVEDASERIFSLLGQLMHGLLERANATGVAERRLFAEVEGWKVSGATDIYYDSGLVQDYKLTTAYKFKDGAAPPEFEQQLNLLAELHRRNGHSVSKLQIVGILRDWSKLEAKRDAGYPQSQIVIIDVPLWAPKIAAKFLRERVILHQKAQQASAALPLCTPEERWARATVFAVMKAGAKRAVKLHDSLEAAKNHATGDRNFYVEKRPGESIRCENYCSVSEFCDQFQGISKLQLSAKPEKVS